MEEGRTQLFTSEIADLLRDVGPELDLKIGAVTPELEAKVHEELPNVDTFLSGLDWLQSPNSADSVAIGHLLLIDETSILVSTIDPGADHQMAIFGTGFKNGVVGITRRLIAQGLKTQ